MRQLLVIPAVLALLLAGCSRAANHPDGAAHNATPTSAPHVRVASVDVTWTAFGARWPLMFRVPFGDAAGEVGARTIPGQPRLIPSALAVTDEGIWILDPVKHRLCLFDDDGHLVHATPGVDELASDLAIDGEGQPVWIDREPDGLLGRLLNGRPRSIHVSWHPAFLTQTEQGALLPLYNRSDPQQFASLASKVRTSIPTGWGPLRFRQGGQDGLRASIAGDGWVTHLRVHSAGPARVDSVELRNDVTVDGATAYLGLRPGTFTSDARLTIPLYLLEVDLRTGAVSAEKVARAPADWTNQYSHFAVHDGVVYQLVVTQNGIEVRRRP
ncbi:hypothetical protein [Nocardioides jiangxiensis]|uniref:Uncharacterized protein n=1 Tax=Nocardioides jiangxiensis TaxID=3064524 RepID=A0ABT9B457_9ACTN|nr:hypothetical protein [Nocardioides sp. WY-20]MDO7869560.1 hypothetical protein [Nocardioides sp. WY-20]